MSSNYNISMMSNFSVRCVKFPSTIQSVKFSHEGDQLAIGEENGNVNIISFENLNSLRNKVIVTPPSTSATIFKAHDHGLDYLTSQEITAGVENIEWLKKCNESSLLLTANKKAVKLWRIRESNKCIASGQYNVCKETKSKLYDGKLNIPKIIPSMPLSHVYMKKEYKRLQHYSINSLSVNNDQKTFLCGDDLRINLWDLEIEHDCMNLVDLKAKLKFDSIFTCLICTKAHTTKSNMFGYGLSNGEIKLADTRDRDCDSSAKIFPRIQPDTTYRQSVGNHFDWTYAISFSNNGRYLLSRDIHTLKIWDINNEKEPLALYYVDENLTSSLHAVKELDRLVDRLSCSWSGDDSHIMTGCFGSSFKTINCCTGEENLIRADCSTGSGVVEYFSEKREFGGEQDLHCMELDCPINDFEFNKIGCVDWNKKKDMIATASMENLIFYTNECADTKYSYKKPLDLNFEVIENFSEKNNKENEMEYVNCLINVLNNSNISIRDPIDTL
uniref:Serine/threonine-protein phosphatase 2A 55 kDa regulatory subunit B n=1 Tax=Parastrongyloides trichosuri TaxID=131310 RepID=A0A0N4Z2H8_PARTI